MEASREMKVIKVKNEEKKSMKKSRSPKVLRYAKGNNDYKK